jgi:hypothetical protein
MRLSVAAVLGAAALLLLNAAPAAAQTPTTTVVFGRVLAYTAPTATAAGSITIGTRIFELPPGSLALALVPTPLTIGSDVWFTGLRRAAGEPFFVYSVRPKSGICSEVTAFAPSTATTRGSITFGPQPLPIALGVTLSQAQTTGFQCFSLGVDTRGDAEVVAHDAAQTRRILGPTRTSPATGTASTPTSTAATPRVPQLPATSTGASESVAVLCLVVVGAIAIGATDYWRSRARGDP